MQQTPMKRNEKIRMGVKGFFWTAGLLIAGSDGNYMPWVNGIGLLLFVASSILLARQTVNAGSTAGTSDCSCFYGKSGIKKKQGYPLMLPAIVL